MLRISNVKISVDSEQMKAINRKISMALKVNRWDIKNIKIVKKAIDARGKSNVCFVYTADFSVENEEKYLGLKNISKGESSLYIVPKVKKKEQKRPVIIGAGPAGIFAALVLCEAGLNPIIIEQGKPVDKRKADVDLFWKTGKLDPESNVQFGEGGAGAFSDGKLTTGVSDIRINKVLQEFIEAGAPEEIAYNAKAHIGTDKLFVTLQGLRKKIISLGGEYRFNSKFQGFESNNGKLNSIKILDSQTENLYDLDCDVCIMALGHSSRQTYEMLEKSGVHMEAKAFSAGVRVEHTQESINKSQYGKFFDHKSLGAADYKLNCKSAGRGVYTFCMCPGGMVVAAASEKGGLVTNGMSYHARDSENANSAVLVSLFPEDFAGDSPLRGMYFQRELEKKAFSLGGSDYKAPVQLLGDFVKDRASKSVGGVLPSYTPGFELCDLRECLPPIITDSLKGSFAQFGAKIKGFDSYDAVLTAVESRSSSPVRIIRNEKMHSNIEGLIPCGEGAGYAGGIMSAAVDGIKCAEAVTRA